MDNDLPAPNPPATNNVEAYLAMLAGVQDLPMPATINNNVEYYLRYLVEHGGGGGGIPTDVIDTIWFGTQEQYDAIVTKAEKTLYLVQEETATANTLSASPAILTLPKINLGNANILNNVDNITPKEEIEEPEVEEENLSEEPEEEPVEEPVEEEIVEEEPEENLEETNIEEE